MLEDHSRRLKEEEAGRCSDLRGRGGLPISGWCLSEVTERAAGSGGSACSRLPLRGRSFLPHLHYSVPERRKDESPPVCGFSSSWDPQTWTRKRFSADLIKAWDQRKLRSKIFRFGFKHVRIDLNRLTHFLNRFHRKSCAVNIDFTKKKILFTV